MQTMHGSDAAAPEPLLNERFRAWFGNSQVVDADGQPLAVCHGTPRGLFDVFDKARKGKTTFIGITVEVQRHGFYFAADPDFARSFAEQSNSRVGAVLDVYLNIRKPLRIPASGVAPADVEALVAQGVSRTWLEDHAGDPDNTWEALDDEEGAFFTGAVKAAGYDGILMQERCPDTGELKDIWIAFEPNQVKSIFNPGTWDPESPRLRDAAPMAEIAALCSPKRPRRPAIPATAPGPPRR